MVNAPSSISALSHPSFTSTERTQFLYLQECLDKGDFHEAIQQLLSLLLAKSLHNPEKIYEYLAQLIIHFDESDIRKLEECLIDFFKIYSPNIVEQKTVVLALASWYVGQVKESSPYFIRLAYYHHAMRYFVQAIKLIGNSSSDVREIHFQASQLFMRIIESHLLQSNTFKDRIDAAKRAQDYSEAVPKLLSQLQYLKGFCCTEDDQNIIRSLYRQAKMS